MPTAVRTAATARRYRQTKANFWMGMKEACRSRRLNQGIADLQTALTPPKVIYCERERAYYISSTGAKGRLEALALPLLRAAPSSISVACDDNASFLASHEHSC